MSQYRPVSIRCLSISSASLSSWFGELKRNIENNLGQEIYKKDNWPNENLWLELKPTKKNSSDLGKRLIWE